MSVSTYSSLPRTQFRGIKDESAVNLVMPGESLPIRVPLFFTLAAWGETDKARYVDGDGQELLYGKELTNPRSKFFTHQSQFIRSHFAAGGKALLQRIVPADAKRATARLSLDMVADELPVFERNADGTFKLDAQGAKIVVVGETVQGFRLQWKMVEIPANGFGVGVAGEGGLVSGDDGAISVLSPVLDITGRHIGEKGKNLGFRLSAPTVNTVDPADADLSENLGTFLYRIQMIERSNAQSTARLISNLDGGNYVDFSLKKGAVDLSTDIEYYGAKNIIRSYETSDMSQFTGFGNFEKLNIYDANIAGILTQLKDAEEAHTGDEIADAHLINILTGVDVHGVPYNTFVVEGPQAGGLLFTETSNHFLQGGSDGTIGVAEYNALVDTVLSSIDDAAFPFADIARMPYDSVWDSGFPVDTKLKFANFHAIRPDVYIHACTQDVLKPLNSAAADSSIGVTLRSHFRASQESAEFGTKACRYAVVMSAGRLINDNYDGLVPFLEWLLIKGAEYMSAADGSMNSDFAFGRGEQNIVTRYRDHNAGTKLVGARKNDWDNGLNYAEWFDMSRLFYAGIQSIYETHTSVLHGYLNTQIACNLTRIGHIVWREMSGDSQLTDEEFLDAVTDKVTERTTGKYDGRVTITPNAYYNALDEALGFSWHLDIGMAGDNIRTVQNLAVIAQRRRNEE